MAVALVVVVVVVAEDPAIGVPVPVPMEKGTTGATVAEPEPALKLNPLENGLPI